MDDDDLFDGIKVSLQGTTVIQAPRVSREVIHQIEGFTVWKLILLSQTIISVLETHTDLIKMLKKVNIIWNPDFQQNS